MTGEPLRVAIATSFDPGIVMPRLRALCEALERELERPTSGHLMIAYEELERGAQCDDFHLMWLPPLVALAVVPRGEASALAVPVREGETSYATALFTRPGSAITALADLKGKRVGWVDPQSCAGYVLPKAFLAAKGIAADEDLAEQLFLGSHERVVAAVLGGKVDFGASYLNGSDGGELRGPWGEREVRVIAQHGPIPADLLASGRALDPELCRSLEERLVRQPDSELARLSRALMRCDAFAEPEPSHLDALSSLVARES